jgi:hypothetical protein
MDDLRAFGPAVPTGPARSPHRTAAGWLAGLGLSGAAIAATVLLWLSIDSLTTLGAASVCFAVAVAVSYGLAVAGIALAAGGFASVGDPSDRRPTAAWIAITGSAFGSALVLIAVVYATTVSELDRASDADPRVGAVLVIAAVAEVAVLLPLAAIGVSRRSTWSRGANYQDW